MHSPISVLMRLGGFIIGFAVIGLSGCGDRDVVNRLQEASTRSLSDCELERSPLGTRRTPYGRPLDLSTHQMWTVVVKDRHLSLKLTGTTAATDKGERVIRRLEAREPGPSGRYQVVWEGFGPPGSGLLWADVVTVHASAVVALGYEKGLRLLTVAPATRGLYVSEPIEILTAESQIVGVRLQRSEDRLHLAWAEETSCLDIFDSRLYYVNADLYGERWSAPRCLSETAVISTINLLADRGEVFVGWSDHRFREGDGEYALNQAKAFVVRSRDDGDTFGRPRMLNNPYQDEDNAALLYLAPAGEDLVVFWARLRDGVVGNTWQHGLLDRDLTTLREWGPITGQEIADVYHQRVAGGLRATARAMPESPWSD
ncbi:MAG: hypothetical protein ACYS0G_08200 [Planctomycetota bacterium]